MGVIFTVGSFDKMEQAWNTLQRRDGTYEPLYFLGPFDTSCYVIVQDAEHIRTILTASDFTDFPKHSVIYRLAEAVVGYGIVHKHGDAWKLSRRLATPLFHFKALKEHSKEMLSQSVQLVEKIDAAGPEVVFDVKKLISKTTLAVIISLAFGNDFDVDWMTEQEEKLQSMFGAYATQAAILGFFATDNIPGLAGSRIWAQRNLLEERILLAIQERKKRLENAAADEQVDLLSLLILNRDDEGVGLSDYEISQECLTFMFAGYDTSATTSAFHDSLHSFLVLIWRGSSLPVTWMMYHLSSNPSIQEKVHKEIDSVLKGRAVPSVDEATRFPYLRDVMREALRLAPPTAVVTRQAKNDTRLGDFFIPKGTALAMSFMSVGRDPRYWDDPLVFRPERWSNIGNEETASGAVSPARHPFAYVPFSAGLRNCLGQKFAQQEMILILATVLKRFQVEIDPTRPVKLTMEVMTVPGNFHARFVPRQS
jgi:cytochrome P450